MPFLPPFNPDNFVSGQPVDNRFFPLQPGAIQTYFGSVEDPDTGEEHTEGNDFFVTSLTTEINGIEVIIVRDTAYDDGVLVEDTIDWFAQDRFGNVWYLGEIVNNYVYNEHNGRFIETNHDGSWEAGVDGALPGWIMEAVSRVGDSYFQEFSPGVAVDEALVTARNLTVTADDVTYNRVLQIEERSALEPGIFGFKYYAPGIGLVRVEEFDAEGNLEFISELIGTRTLSRTDQRGLDAPEPDDLAAANGALSVQIVAADTENINALGAYTYDRATGVIGEAWIVDDSIEADDLLTSYNIDVPTGQGVGLFIVPDSESLGLDLSRYEDGGLFFVNMATGGAATLGDGMAPIVVDADGNPLPIQAYHALGSDAGVNLLNPGAGINAIEQGGDDFIYFEETRVTDPDFDGDFDDLIIAMSEAPLSEVGDKHKPERLAHQMDGAYADAPDLWLHALGDDWTAAPSAELWA